jgi:hypothetical protein
MKVGIKFETSPGRILAMESLGRSGYKYFNARETIVTILRGFEIRH